MHSDFVRQLHLLSLLDEPLAAKLRDAKDQHRNSFRRISKDRAVLHAEGHIVNPEGKEQSLDAELPFQALVDAISTFTEVPAPLLSTVSSKEECAQWALRAQQANFKKRRAREEADPACVTRIPPALAAPMLEAVSRLNALMGACDPL